MSEAIDLITLRVIVTAADAGSISAAGDRMGLAVAAASTRVSQLEEALGFRVFERSPRGVQLTPAGHMLAQRARELLANAERLALDLRDYSRGLQGQVRVLANASALIEVLPGMLDAFLRAHPAIRLVLEERSSSEIPLALLEGRADLGVLDIAHAPQGIALHAFFRDTLVLCVPAGHRLATAGRLALAEAFDEDFIALTDGTALSHRLIAAAAEAGRAIRIRMQMRSFDAVCRMIAGGLGVGVLPLEAIAPQLAHLPLVAVPLTDAWATRTHHLATRAEGPAVPAARTLMRALTGFRQ